MFQAYISAYKNLAKEELYDQLIDRIYSPLVIISDIQQCLSNCRCQPSLMDRAIKALTETRKVLDILEPKMETHNVGPTAWATVVIKL